MAGWSSLGIWLQADVMLNIAATLFKVLANPFQARNHLKELEKLRWIARAVNQNVQTLVLIKVGSRIQRTLEDETREVDLAQIDIAMNRMTLQALGKLTRNYTQLAEAPKKKEYDVASVIAMSILASWLRCKVIARRSLNKKVLEEAREMDNLYFRHIQNFLRGVRLETSETIGSEASDMPTARGGLSIAPSKR